jgi:hypothetical protein
MSFILGWGRYARETYPTSPVARSSPGGTIPPLSRAWFIDAGSAASSPTGAINAAFPTATAFFGNISAISSAADAQSLWTGLLTPASGGYTDEAATIVPPPCRNVEIVAAWGDAIVQGGSDAAFTLATNIAWAVGTDPNQPATASLTLRDVFITGNLTATDVGGSPPSYVSVLAATTGGGNPAGFVSCAGVGGNLDTSGASQGLGTQVQNAVIYGTTDTNASGLSGINSLFLGAVGSNSPHIVAAQDCDFGLTVAATGLDAYGCDFGGNVTSTSGIYAEDTEFSGTALTVSGSAALVGCTFGLFSPPPTLTFNSGVTITSTGFYAPTTLVVPSPEVATFDIPSWASFVEQGGTQGTSIVLVMGGFSGGAGAVVSPDGPVTSAAPSSIILSLNGTGATSPWVHGGNSYFVNSVPDGGLTILLGSSGALPGDTICVTNNDRSGLPVTVQDQTTGLLTPTAPITLTGPGSVIARWTGTSWVLLQVGQTQGQTLYTVWTTGAFSCPNVPAQVVEFQESGAQLSATFPSTPSPGWSVTAKWSKDTLAPDSSSPPPVVSGGVKQVEPYNGGAGGALAATTTFLGALYNAGTWTYNGTAWILTSST